MPKRKPEPRSTGPPPRRGGVRNMLDELPWCDACGTWVAKRGHWILVQLEGVRTNRSGYGSVVELVRKDGTSVKRWVRGDGSYLAANDPRVHFGLGQSTDVERIQVQWLSGGCESWSPIVVDRTVNLREGTGQACAER